MDVQLPKPMSAGPPAAVGETMIFDPIYFVYVLPAMILMVYAQFRIKSAYAAGLQIPARLSGAAAARYILDQAGCQDVAIEQIPGMLSDHYDPRARVLRLSPDVYSGRSATSVGIAAHEAGHALQHAFHYLPLAIRNAAAPAATFGGTAFMILLIIGMLLHSFNLMALAVILIGLVLVFQVV